MVGLILLLSQVRQIIYVGVFIVCYIYNMSMRDCLICMHVAELRDARPIAGGHKHDTNQAYMMSVCEAYQ